MEAPKKRTIIYQFNHSRMGFQNEITPEAYSLDEAHAIEQAKAEVSKAYGSAMLKRFSFKIKPAAK